MKLRLPRKRRWRAAIYLGSFLLVATAVDLVMVQARRRIAQGFDTTRIIEPTLPDGSIDYLTAIEDHFGRGITSQNNAAVPLVQALGRVALPTNQPPDGITGRLGMQPLPEKGDYFQGYEQYRTAQSAPDEPDPTDPRTETPWPTTVSAATREWVEANRIPLALIEEASNRSRFFMPFNGGNRPTMLIEILLAYLNPLGDVRRAVLTRATMRLDTGDFDGFRADVLTVHRLARLLAQGATLIDRIVALDMEVAACRAEQHAATGGRLSREQLVKFATELAGLPALVPFDEAVDACERYMVLDILQKAARAGPSRPVLLDAFSTVGAPSNRAWIWDVAYRFWPVPYEQSMRVMNHFYDGALAAVRLPTYPQRRAALLLWEQDIIRIHDRSFVPKMLSAEWPAEVFLPSMLGAVWRQQRASAEQRLTQIALLLAAYKLDHGAYPAALSELSPEYVSAIPDDPFAEKSLIYSRTSAGYRVYSVGPNMVDDGGMDQKPGDDIVVNTP